LFYKKLAVSYGTRIKADAYPPFGKDVLTQSVVAGFGAEHAGFFALFGEANL
jgi:hypothetical protein